jgi:hypothetical protein
MLACIVHMYQTFFFCSNLVNEFHLRACYHHLFLVAFMRHKILSWSFVLGIYSSKRGMFDQK